MNLFNQKKSGPDIEIMVIICRTLVCSRSPVEAGARAGEVQEYTCVFLK